MSLVVIYSRARWVRVTVPDSVPLLLCWIGVFPAIVNSLCWFLSHSESVIEHERQEHAFSQINNDDDDNDDDDDGLYMSNAFPIRPVEVRQMLAGKVVVHLACCLWRIDCRLVNSSIVSLLIVFGYLSIYLSIYIISSLSSICLYIKTILYF